MLIPASEVQVNDYVVYGDKFRGKVSQVDSVGCGVRIYLESNHKLVLHNAHAILVNPKR